MQASKDLSQFSQIFVIDTNDFILYNQQQQTTLCTSLTKTKIILCAVNIEIKIVSNRLFRRVISISQLQRTTSRQVTLLVFQRTLRWVIVASSFVYV